MRNIFTIKYVIILLVAFSFQRGQAQFNLKSELAKTLKIPNSPEAEAFTKYGDLKSNMYSGTPNIDVPIHTIKGREFDLPISLSYDASGIKVEQEATQVGLGWNLNVGGRISRIVNGATDDFKSANPEYFTIFDNEVTTKMNSYIQENQYFNSEQATRDYFYFLKDVATGKYDTQPDYFSLNVMGVNDYMVIDIITKQPRCLNNPRIIAEIIQDQATSSITGWIITNEDGTKYFFEKAEETFYQNGDDDFEPIQGELPYGLTKTYNSSWVLTKIESINKKDIYTFDYIDLGYWTQPLPTDGVSVNSIATDDGNAIANTYNIGYGINRYSYSVYNIKQQFLSNIKQNGALLVSLTLKPRLDFTIASALSKIELYKYNSAEVMQTITFNHTYFGNSAGLAPSNIAMAVRLKLDNVIMSAPNTTAVKKYSFDYENATALPKKNAMSQDILGYNNGVNNTVLYPKITIGNDFYDGANRNPNFEYSKIGILNKMTYPTGGSTVFEYEPHTTHYTQEDVNNEPSQFNTYASLQLAGGLLTQTSFYDPLTECNGLWCQSLYPSPPKVAYYKFYISADGYFDIKYTRVGQTTNSAMAYVVKSGGYRNGVCGGSGKLNSFMDLSNGSFYYPETVVFTSTSGGNERKFLTSGCYLIAIIDGSVGSTSTVVVGRNEVVSSGVIGVTQVARAGIRIKSIKDYTKPEELSLFKEYKYTTDINNSISSAKFIHSPNLTYKSTVTRFVQGSTLSVKTFQYMNRISSATAGDNPYVKYSKVFEILKNSTAERNGYIEYNFNNSNDYPLGFGVSNFGLPPYVNYFSNDYKLGKESEVTVYRNDNTKLSTTNYAYENQNYYLNKGIYLKPNDGMNYKYPKVVYDSATNKYGYQFVDAVFGCLQATINYQTYGDCDNLYQQPCNEPGCINDPKLASYSSMQITTAKGSIGNMTISTKTEFFDNKIVTNTAENVYYDASNKYLLNTTKNNELQTKYYYPTNLPNEPNVEKLIANNIVNTPLKTEVYRGAEKLSEQKVQYGSFVSQNPTTQYLLPQYLYFGKENNVEKRITYDNYDDKGNLVQYTTDAGIPVTIIWGYNKTYPIAKLENTTYASIPSSTIIALQNLTNAVNAIDPAQELLICNSLDALRTSLSNTMVTSYTYKPFIGISTMIDAKGNKTTYSYDEFNRLKEVKDKDGNILSENQYYYKQ